MYTGETVNKKKSPAYLIEDGSVKSSPGIHTHPQTHTHTPTNTHAHTHNMI